MYIGNAIHRTDFIQTCGKCNKKSNEQKKIDPIRSSEAFHPFRRSIRWVNDRFAVYVRTEMQKQRAYWSTQQKKTQQQQRKFHLFFLPIWLLMDDIWTNSDFSSPFGSIVEWILIVYRTFLILKRNLLFSGLLRWSIPYLFQLFSFDCNWI